jgi:hypothetical protein
VEAVQCSAVPDARRSPLAPPRHERAQVVSTWLNAAGTASYTGDGGDGAAATSNVPDGITLAGGAVYVTERGSGTVRRLDLSTRIATTYAGTGTATSSTGNGLDRLAATFFVPLSAAALPDGSILVAEFNGCVVRRITADGVVQAFAGNGTCGTVSTTGVNAVGAILSNVAGVTVADAVGGVNTVYIGNYGANRVGAQA